MNRLLLLLSLVACLQACAGGGGPDQTPGCLYSSLEGPIATGPSAKKKKTGRACSSNILGIIATGDSSIATAARLGGVNKIATVDYDRSNILSVYTKVCTIVRGE